jgi:serine protease AprX
MLDPQAILRRQRLGLAIWDEKDWPLNPEYVAAVTPLVDSVRYQLRWLNALTVRARPEEVASLISLPFVRAVRPFRSQAVLTQRAVSKAKAPNARLDTLLSLTRNLTHLDSLQKAGLSGKGIRIALLDAGFKGVLSHPAFENLRQRQGIVATYDFYKGKEKVFQGSSHGLEVLSCVAGTFQGRPLGAAWNADFLLARVVKAFFAAHNEEDHWIAAAEWAERKGADIISTSVTYVENYRTPGEMDGQSSPVTQAAQIATQKGVLVVSAMGNQGDKRWRIMGAPADAEEVLSVGGTYPMIPQRLPMASVGPNARRKLKPDVAAPAFVLSALKGKKYGENTGTSFSCPLVAGIAACLLEKEPDLAPAQLLSRIQRAGHFFPYYDYDLGYGVPDMRLLLRDSIASATDSLFQVRLSKDTVWVELDTVYMRTDSTRFPYGHMLYYHLERPEQYLSAYQTFRLPNLTESHYFLRRRPTFGKMRIWMDGFLYEKRFNGE